MEDIIAKCESEYDLETIKKFNKVHMYSQKGRVAISVIAFLLILYSILFTSADTIFRVVCGFIGVVWFIELITLPNIWSKKTYKTSKFASGAKVKAEFFSNKLIITTIKDEKEVGKTTLEYSDLYKVLETKDTIYLYIGANQAFICTKTHMEGDYDKLVELLKEKLDKKYISKVKNNG